MQSLSKTQRKSEKRVLLKGEKLNFKNMIIKRYKKGLKVQVPKSSKMWGKNM